MSEIEIVLMVTIIRTPAGLVADCTGNPGKGAPVEDLALILRELAEAIEERERPAPMHTPN